MRMMTRSMTTAAVLYAATVSSAHAQAAMRVNFTGTWVIDLAKSQTSAALPTAATYTISQHGDTLLVDRDLTYEEAGHLKSRLVVGFDGKAWKNTAPQADGDVETSTVVTWDKGVMILVTTGNIQGTDFTQTDRWTLAADGKSFVIVRSITVQSEEVQSATWAFTKKS
jgi:hypothetical protein